MKRHHSIELLQVVSLITFYEKLRLNCPSHGTGNTETVKVLIEDGANIHSTNILGQTALYVAAWNGY